MRSQDIKGFAETGMELLLDSLILMKGISIEKMELLFGYIVN